MTYLPLLSGIQSGYEFIFLTSASYLVYTFQLDHSLIFSQAVRQVFNSITSRQTGRLFSLNWFSHNVSWLSVQLLLSADPTSKWEKEKYVNAVLVLGDFNTQICKRGSCVPTSGDMENKMQSCIKNTNNAKPVTVLFHNRTQFKTRIFGLNGQPIESTFDSSFSYFNQ